VHFCCRSLCGERGLKSDIYVVKIVRLPSLPLRGAWIEIIDRKARMSKIDVAPFAGSVD